MRKEAPVLEAEISDLSHDGCGVTRVDGKVVFVEGALPGEQVRLRVRRRGRDFDQAELVELLRAAPERVEPRCAHFGTCGGCVLQHMDPEAQIAAKQKQLLENFKRIAAVQPERVLAPLTAQVWNYRRKARLSVKWVAKKGRVVVGFRERNPRFVADVRACEVLDERVGRRIDALAEVLGELAISAEIPQVEVAAGDGMPALVVRHLRALPEADRERLIAFAQAEGLAIYLQPGGIDSVHLLWPERHQPGFALPELGLNYHFAPLDFVQVNDGINRAMIAHALELLAPTSDDIVLDLFCGLGNFSLPIAQRAGRVVGIEGEAGLVQRARDNAAANGLANVEFHVADLAQDLATAGWARGPYSAVLIDPPRTGAQALLEQLRFPNARRLLYVSCHPGSLARDARILVERHRYRLVAAGVMDMFPHTAHVESIALFQRGTS